jgi:hypothetical protein
VHLHCTLQIANSFLSFAVHVAHTGSCVRRFLSKCCGDPLMFRIYIDFSATWTNVQRHSTECTWMLTYAKLTTTVTDYTSRGKTPTLGPPPKLSRDLSCRDAAADREKILCDYIKFKLRYLLAKIVNLSRSILSLRLAGCR